ncbi:MAG TPA: tetratricopeptide repeat protein [Armatimonadota bacterium]
MPLVVVAMPPSNAVRGGVFLRSDANVGEAWFDDIELTVEVLSATGKLNPPGSEPGIEPYRAFLSENPTGDLAEEARLRIVDSLRFAGKHQRAIDELRQMVAKPKGGAAPALSGQRLQKALMDLGWLLFDTRQLGEALAAYEAALPSLGRADELEAKLVTGEIKAMQGDLAGAVAHLNKLLTDRPEAKARVLLRMAAVYRHGSDYKEASRCIERALPLLRDDPTLSDDAANALYGLAECCLQNGDLEGTIKAGRDSMARYPFSPSTVAAVDFLMAAYAKQRRYDQIRDVASWLLDTRKDPGDRLRVRAYAQYRLADAYRSEGLRDSAVREFRALIRDYPDSNWCELGSAVLKDLGVNEGDPKGAAVPGS